LAAKFFATAKELLVTLFVPRLTFYPLPKSFTFFLDLLKVLVGVGFVIEVPVKDLFDLRD